MVYGGFSDSTGESILNSLETVYLGDVYVKENKIAVSQFSADYRCSDVRCSFELEHGVDSLKVVNYEAGKKYE